MSVTQDAWKKLQAEYERTAGRATNIDYNGVIRGRKTELYEMASSRKRPSAVLEKFDEETRERILRIDALEPKQFKSDIRKTWKKEDLFRFAGRMSLMFVKTCLQRKNRIQIYKRYIEEPDEKISRTGRGRSKSTGSKSSLGHGMVVALTTPPEARTQKHLRKIAWILGTTKAFRQLFPPDRETECAKYLSYAKYDDGRLIAQQDCKADWFYYVIAGKVILLRQYELTSGVVNKPMGYLIKGMTSDPEEIENQTEREFSLVAKGQVEVLLLHKTMYRQLQSLGDGPPISYLSKLELFEEFPVEMFIDHPECVEMKYYGDGKVIVKDTNRTPWIHIVKSGLIKVVRRQMILNSVADIFNQQNDDQLGCIKPPSHAYAMLGVNYKQRQNKLRSGEQSLFPQLTKKRCLLNGGTKDSGTKNSTTEQSPERRPNPVIRISEEPVTSKSRTAVIREDVIVENFSGRAEIGILREEDEGDEEEDEDSHRPSSPARSDVHTLPPLINIPSRSHTTDERRDFVPHSFYLTREKTDASALRGKRSVEERRAYLELGTLGPGDVFGLEHMGKTASSEPQGFSLLSDGVEVVKVSKRFFLQYAQNNTMLKLETLNQQYMSDQEAKESLHDLQLWNKYKSSLMDRMSDRVISKNSSKHRRPGIPVTSSRFQGHSNELRTSKLPVVSQSARF